MSLGNKIGAVENPKPEFLFGRKRGIAGDIATEVLVQPRLRAPRMRLPYSNNINPDVKGKIFKTLLKIKNDGLEEQTVKIVGYCLNHLAVNVSETSSIFDNFLGSFVRR